MIEGKGEAYGVWEGKSLVGCVSWEKRNPHHANEAEVGYWVSADSQGKGIMTRTLSFVVKHLFDTLSIDRLVLRILEGNTRSHSLAARLNFVQEGTLREGALLYGKAHDVVAYSLLRSEWLSADLEARAAVEAAEAEAIARTEAAAQARARKIAALTSGPSIFTDSATLAPPKRAASKSKPTQSHNTQPQAHTSKPKPKPTAPSIFGGASSSSSSSSSSAKPKAATQTQSIFGSPEPQGPAAAAPPASTPTPVAAAAAPLDTSDDESSSDDPPPSKKKAAAPAPSAAVSLFASIDDDDDDDLFGSAPAKKTTTSSNSKPKASLFGDDDDGDDGDFWF